MNVRLAEADWILKEVVDSLDDYVHDLPPINQDSYRLVLVREFMEKRKLDAWVA